MSDLLAITVDIESDRTGATGSGRRGPDDRPRPRAIMGNAVLCMTAPAEDWAVILNAFSKSAAAVILSGDGGGGPVGRSNPDAPGFLAGHQPSEVPMPTRTNNVRGATGESVATSDLPTNSSAAAGLTPVDGA
jgi:hypothetical protein